RATVIWLVQPASGGSRLRVIQSGLLGHPMRTAEQTQLYQVIFGEQLRLFLRSGMLTRLDTPVEPPTRAPGTVLPLAPVQPAGGRRPLWPTDFPGAVVGPPRPAPAAPVPIPDAASDLPRRPAVWRLPAAPTARPGPDAPPPGQRPAA